MSPPTPTMRPIIRPATTGDVEDVLAFWIRADAHPSPTDTVHDLARVVAAPHAELLVAVDQRGTVVGSVIATFDGWRGNVYRMAVDPALRRRGLARRLADAAEGWLRAAGAVRLSALVEGDNTIAPVFWESVGFARYEGMRRYSKNL
jgi:ribosomal protein S18 acetylase RimI-like enzyme